MKTLHAVSIYVPLVALVLVWYVQPGEPLWEEPYIFILRNMAMPQYADPQSQAIGCEMLNKELGYGAGITVSRKDLQAQMVEDKSYLQVVETMRQWKESLNVQVSCGQFLGNLVIWNATSGETVAKNGGMTLLIDALRQFGSPACSLIGSLGGFMDFVEENKNHFRSVGGIELAYQIAQEGRPDCIFLWMCYVSTANAASTQKILELGFMNSSIQWMKEFPEYPGVVGETFWDIANQIVRFGFFDQIADQFIELGYVEEMVKGLTTERLMHAKGTSLDPIGFGGQKTGMARFYHSCFIILAELAKTPKYRDYLRRAASVDIAEDALVARGGWNLYDVAPWGWEIDVLDAMCNFLSIMSMNHSAWEFSTRLLEELKKAIYQRSRAKVPRCEWVHELTS